MTSEALAIDLRSIRSSREYSPYEPLDPYPYSLVLFWHGLVVDHLVTRRSHKNTIYHISISAHSIPAHSMHTHTHTAPFRALLGTVHNPSPMEFPCTFRALLTTVAHSMQEAYPAAEAASRREAIFAAATSSVPVTAALLADTTASDATRQAALLSLDAVAAALQGAAAAVLVPCVPALAAAVRAENASVRGSAIACLGRVTSAAGNQMVPYLPLIVPLLLERATAALADLSAGPASAVGDGGDVGSADGDGDEAVEALEAATVEMTAALAALSTFLGTLAGMPQNPLYL